VTRDNNNNNSNNNHNNNSNNNNNNNNNNNKVTGTVSKPLGQYLSNITGKHEIKEIHKTAILGTAHILRKVLM